MRLILTLWSGFLAAGCGQQAGLDDTATAPDSGPFSPFATGSSTTPFANAYTSAEDLVLRRFSVADLVCPDGEPAAFFTVSPEALSASAPIVLVFHSGAFDYVDSPSEADPLGGAGYRAVRRLSAEWAEQKVYETLGIRPGAPLDPPEVNAGTLPAALAEEGALAIYPADCWADLWHNEDYYAPNDWEADGGIHRQGRFLAWWMTRVASQDVAQASNWRAAYGFEALSPEAAAVYLVGLGEGGRAALELSRRVRDAADADMPSIGGTIVDSTMDDLAPLLVDDAFAAYNVGLGRIFPDVIDTEGEISQYSYAGWVAANGLDAPLQLVWSSQDPEVPAETLAALVALAADEPDLIVTDRAEPGHVFLNNDQSAARAAVRLLLGR